jgi:hypothetical protein
MSTAAELAGSSPARTAALAVRKSTLPWLQRMPSVVMTTSSGSEGMTAAWRRSHVAASASCHPGRFERVAKRSFKRSAESSHKPGER